MRSLLMLCLLPRPFFQRKVEDERIAKDVAELFQGSAEDIFNRLDEADVIQIEADKASEQGSHLASNFQSHFSSMKETFGAIFAFASPQKTADDDTVVLFQPECQASDNPIG